MTQISLPGINLVRLRSWGTRGGMAVLDQGIFSGSNFVLNILLARWLAPAEYGAFAVAFTVFLFLSGFHSAILLEPMSVIGPANYTDRMSAYLDRQIRLHFALTIPAGLLTAATGAALLAARVGDEWLAQALVGAGLALPFMLFLWTVRRMFYVVQRQAGALISSTAYLLILFPGIWLLHKQQAESSLTGFALMGFASALASLLTLVWRKLGSRKAPEVVPMREVWGAHWGYGKWALAAAFLSLAYGQVQIFFTASMVSLEAAGVLRAMQNFMLPMLQAVIAISLIGLPALSYDYGRGELRSLRRKGLFLTMALTGIAIVYELITWPLASSLEHLVYGGKYSAYAGLIAPLGLIPIFAALAAGFSLILRSIQKPKSILISGIVTGIAGVASSVLFIKIWGVAGGVASLVFAYLASFLVAGYLYRAWFPSKEPTGFGNDRMEKG